MKNARLTLIISIIVIISFMFILRYSGNSSAAIDETRLMMGTLVQIKIPEGAAKNTEAARTSVKKAFAEIERIENVFSVFKLDSEISRINRIHANEKLIISGEVFALIQDSIKYAKMTEGAFDVTVKPLVELWKRSAETGILPSDKELKVALSKVGYQYIVLDYKESTILFQKEGMSIDMGGVAKGYATDRAIAILKDIGISNAIVNSGGDMYCLGKKTKNSLWKVGIQHPRKKDVLMLELNLGDKAIDSSGDYEKYFEIRGKRYSHIINPKTGYPIDGDVVASTVIADDSKTADMLATALCVLGRDGLVIADSVPGACALVIANVDGALKIYKSPVFEKMYEEKK